eukprot:3345724-Amphidinium_carterae.1
MDNATCDTQLVEGKTKEERASISMSKQPKIPSNVEHQQVSLEITAIQIPDRSNHVRSRLAANERNDDRLQISTNGWKLWHGTAQLNDDIKKQH